MSWILKHKSSFYWRTAFAAILTFAPFGCGDGSKSPGDSGGDAGSVREVAVEKKQGDFEWSENGDGTLTLKEASKDLSGAVEIPAEVDGKKVTRIGKRAFSFCDALESITLPSGLLEIDDSAFSFCRSLKSASLPDGLSTIGGDAFSSCQLLQSIAIPVGVSKIGDGAFSGCESLESATLPDGLSEIGERAFFRCQSLKTLTLPNGLSEIGFAAFLSCENLTLVAAPETVGAKYAAENRLAVRAPGAAEPTNDPNDVGDAFELKWRPNGAGTLAFEGVRKKLGAKYRREKAEAPTVLVIPDEVDGKKVTEISISAFSSFKTLESLTLPSGLKKLDAQTFFYCKSLKSLTLPAEIEKLDAQTFANCDALESLSIAAESPYFSSVDGVLFDKSGATLIAWPRGKKDARPAVADGVKTIAADAFSGCKSLETLTFPASLAEIGSGAFSDCVSLKSFSVAESNPKFSSVDGVLFGDGGATLIAYPAGKESAELVVPDGVRTIAVGAFSGCVSLKSATLSSSVSTLGGAFSDCVSLEAFSVAESNPTFSSVDGVLFSKDGATLINYPIGKAATEYAVPNGVETIAGRAFGAARFLESITFPAELAQIDARAFGACVSLKSFSVAAKNLYFSSVDGVLFSKDGATLVKYPTGRTETEYAVPSGVKTIDDFAFANCGALKSATFPDGLLKIGELAFSNCRSLESVALPSSLSEVADGAFLLCPNLSLVAESETFASKRAVDSGVPVRAPGDPEDAAFRFRWKDNRDGTLTLEGFSNAGGSRFDPEVDLPTAVVVPDEVDGKKVTEIDETAFWNCASLESLTLPAGLKEFEAHTFSKCSSLKSFSIAAENPRFAAVDGVLFDKDVSTLIAYPAGRKEKEYVVPAGVETIGSYAFSGCKSLEALTLSSELSTTAGVASFLDCDSLKSVTIPSGLAALDASAFSGCKAFESFSVAAGNSNFKSVDGVLFSGDGATLFAYPTGKKAAQYVVPQGVKTIAERAFYSCPALNSITLPASLTTLEYDALTFAKSLTSLSIAAENSNFKTVDDVLFSGDGATLFVYPAGKSAAKYVVPNGVETIGERAFAFCRLLKTAELSNGVKTIGDGAFSYCDALESATIPASVAKIGEKAFQFCPKLTLVAAPGTVGAKYGAESGIAVDDSAK